MDNSLHKKAVSSRVLKDIIISLESLIEALKPYATPLNPKQRQSLPKMGERGFAFVDKGYELASGSPEMFPDYDDMGAFREDYRDAHSLIVAENKAKQLTRMISDIKMSAGSDAFRHTLIFYKHLGVLEQNNVPGAATLRAELKKRFPAVKGGRKARQEAEEQAASDAEQSS